jgi:lipid-A-disaccharide synthase
MKQYTIFISAGEPSGDFLGSQLMKALRRQLGHAVKFTGLGGPLMEAEGMASLFPIEELYIMGLAEIIPHIRRIRRRIHETVKAVEQIGPDIVITIDSPGFNFRIGKMLKKKNILIPLVHYVAPSVWAWRPNRAHEIAQFVDHLLVLLPFEPPYFLKEGLDTHFVGHPVVEVGINKAADSTFRKRHNIPSTAPIITILPGSRRGEVGRLLPIFQQTVSRLLKKYPNLLVVIPTLPHLVNQIKQLYNLPAVIVTSPQEKYAAFKESTAALSASGTISLELAAAELPTVIAYKISPITYAIVKRLVKVKYASLINLLLDEPVMPEHLQADCTPEKLACEVDKLLLMTSKEKTQLLNKLKKALMMLNAPVNELMPSQCSAEHICQFMGIQQNRSRKTVC